MNHPEKHLENGPITMEFDETWKKSSKYRFGHDSGGPEAAGGHSRPKRGCFRYRRPGRAHPIPCVCYSLPGQDSTTTSYVAIDLTPW